MKSKRMMGIVAVIIGVVMIGISMYIANQVAEGQGQVSSAQSKVDMGNSLFSMNPATKDAGKVITGSAQGQIDAGSAQIAYYTQVAHWLLVGGIVVAIAGVGYALFCRKK